MNRIGKNIIIYSMVGMMQLGLGTSAIEASPIYNDDSSRMVQLDNRHGGHDRRRDNERRREHDERMRKENERHEREMRRRHHESEREWHERQRREHERHDNALRDIAAILIGIAIASSGN